MAEDRPTRGFIGHAAAVEAGPVMARPMVARPGRAITGAARLWVGRAQPNRHWHGRRPGGVYVLVLGVALMVTIIGLSALLAVRVELRAVNNTEQTAKADFYAQSAIDLAMFKLAADSSWRTTYTNDTWVPLPTSGNGTCSFKLVDELDGNLANDPTQPVRVYGKAAIGEAVRIYSVQLDPIVYPTLLTNGDMETPNRGWFAVQATLTYDASQAHGGSKSLQIKNRSSLAGGVAQDITASIENGATYSFELWAKMDSRLGEIKLEIGTVDSASGTQRFGGSAGWVGTSWTKLTKSITPSWSGTLSSAAVYVSSRWVTTAFRIDDAVVVKQVSGGSLVPVAGSWRREVLP